MSEIYEVMRLIRLMRDVLLLGTRIALECLAAASLKCNNQCS